MSTKDRLDPENSLLPDTPSGRLPGIAIVGCPIPNLPEHIALAGCQDQTIHMPPDATDDRQPDRMVLLITDRQTRGALKRLAFQTAICALLLEREDGHGTVTEENKVIVGERRSLGLSVLTAREEPILSDLSKIFKEEALDRKDRDAPRSLRGCNRNIRATKARR